MALRLVLDRVEGRLRAGPPGKLAIATVVSLARLQRRRMRHVRVVGITGTAGKTTAKEISAALLAPHFPLVTTPGSANYLSPVALTLLKVRRRHRVAVLELGTAKRGNIAELAKLTRPELGVVTAIGDEHRRSFGTRSKTAREKQALVAALPPAGVAILNADDAYVRPMAEATRARVVTFGAAPEATLRATEVEARWPELLHFTLSYGGRSVPVVTRLPGKHWLPSVLAALAVALELGVELEDAVATLATVEPPPGRMTPSVVDGVAFVRDDAKSHAWAFDAVFEFLAEAQARRKILVVAKVKSFRNGAEKGYRALRERALGVADEVVFAGPDAWAALHGDADADPRVRVLRTIREAAEHVERVAQAGDLVVLKGDVYGGDHVARVVLARTRAVRCWRDDCGRWRFCEECELLGVPAGPGDA